MKQKILFVLIAISFLTINSCKDDITKPVTPPEEIKPGSRNYEWKEYELIPPTYERSMLKDLWASSPSDVWAIGESSLSQLGIWHFDGAAWKWGTETPTWAQTGLWGSSASDVWMGSSEGRLWHFNGSSWELVTKLVVEGYRDFIIQSIWGVSANKIYAVGYGAVSTKYDTYTGAVFKYDGVEWKRVPIPNIALNFHNVRRDKSGDLIIAALDESTGLVSIMSFNGTEFKKLYTATGRVVALEVVGDKTLFSKDQQIYYYENGTYKLWKDFSGTDYYGGIACYRNEKDIFMGAVQVQGYGICHYNGTDIKVIYETNSAWVWLTAGFALERDVFFIIHDWNTQRTKILHGKLKD